MKQRRVSRFNRLHRISRAVQQQGKHLPAKGIVIDNQDLNRHLCHVLHKDTN
jgi:hypothetical protein